MPPSSGTLWDLLVGRVQLTPDALCVMDARRRTLTFAQLLLRAERVAAGLRARGVERDTVVSWQLPGSTDAVVLLLALARLGAVQNPLVPMLRRPDLALITAEAGTDLLVVPDRHRGFDHGAMAYSLAVARSQMQVLVVDEGLPGATAAPGPPAAATAAPRWIFYTSGTTSKPRGARHSDDTLLAGARAYCAALDPTPADRVAVLAPIAHIGGVVHVFSSLLTGSAMIVADTFEPSAAARLLRDAGVTIAGSGVPFGRAFLELQRTRPEDRLFPAIRVFTVGGSPRARTLDRDIRETLGGCGIASGYGLTECPNVSWASPRDAARDREASDGRPGPDVQVRIVRADGSPAERDEAGEIRVTAPQLMLGYVDPDSDVDAFDADGFLCTGDVGMIDDRGYLYVTGRIKDIIIRNMENISAHDVEEALAGHPQVRDVCAVGLPDTQTGERVCVVVVPLDRQDPPTLSQLCEYAQRNGLNTRKLPAQVEIADSLPRNAMGKVLKGKLREQLTVTIPSAESLP